MRIGLYVPCFVDRLAPEVGMAAWTVLERLGVEVVVPDDAPACCGQPFCSSGRPELAVELPGAMARSFRSVDAIVLPSASCTAFIRHHHLALARNIDRAAVSRAPRVWSFSEFLWTGLGLRTLPGRLDARVGLHPGCHGLRELGLGRPSEHGPGAPESVDPVAGVVGCIEGVTVVRAGRVDECCGFGGIFSATEPAVSERMGRDRLAAFAGVDLVVSEDPSCLLHMKRFKTTGPRLLSMPELVLSALDAP